MGEQRMTLAGQKVLVADDEPFSLSIMARMMRELGCAEVIAAPDGATALQALNDGTPPSLAILDFNMPQADGLQILKQTRTGKTAAKRDLPILMLTGSSDFGLVGAAMALDADAFLIKPISLAAMAAKLEMLSPEGPGLKSVEDYGRVDIDAVSRRLLGQKPPTAPARGRLPVKKAKPAGVKIALDAIQVGAVLSEDVRGPAGELLLGKATLLTDRLIQRLRELQAGFSLDHVYVFPPSGEKAE